MYFNQYCIFKCFRFVEVQINLVIIIIVVVFVFVVVVVVKSLEPEAHVKSA